MAIESSDISSSSTDDARHIVPRRRLQIECLAAERYIVTSAFLPRKVLDAASIWHSLPDSEPKDKKLIGKGELAIAGFFNPLV